jgi:acyl carrier protein
MYDKVVAMICEQFGVEPDELTEQTRFVDDLGADSLDVVELTIEMEERFGLDEVPEEELKKLLTVGDLVEYVSAHGNG